MSLNNSTPQKFQPLPVVSQTLSPPRQPPRLPSIGCTFDAIAKGAIVQPTPPPSPPSSCNVPYKRLLNQPPVRIPVSTLTAPTKTLIKMFFNTQTKLTFNNAFAVLHTLESVGFNIRSMNDVFLLMEHLSRNATIPHDVVVSFFVWVSNHLLKGNSPSFDVFDGKYKQLWFSEAGEYFKPYLDKKEEMEKLNWEMREGVFWVRLAACQKYSHVHFRLLMCCYLEKSSITKDRYSEHMYLFLKKVFSKHFDNEI